MKSIAIVSDDASPGPWNWAKRLRTLVDGSTVLCHSEFTGTNVDCVFVVGRLPESEWFDSINSPCPMIYFPFDFFDSSQQILEATETLKRFDKIIVTNRVHETYFASAGNADYSDLIFGCDLPVRSQYRDIGNLLWVGKWTDCQPVISWINSRPSQTQVTILADFASSQPVPSASDLGVEFGIEVQINRWTPLRHKKYLQNCRAVIDIGGFDFRGKNRSPQIIYDYLTIGIPVATNEEHGAVLELARSGLELATPDHSDQLFSPGYWQECCRIGKSLQSKVNQSRNSLLNIVSEAKRHRVKHSKFLRDNVKHSNKSPNLVEHPKVFGLMITKDDEDVLADWCLDQLHLYDHVVCLDGSESEATKDIVGPYADKFVYLHERQQGSIAKSDHGLRRIVQFEIERRFGFGHWIMICHPDEFCYHDPKKVAQFAEAQKCDLVSWFCLHFFPHPSEQRSWNETQHLPVYDRLHHYHWSVKGDGYPWIEDRLFRSSPSVFWDRATHGNTRPNGLFNRAVFFPALCHYKVVRTDLNRFQIEDRASNYRLHWQGQNQKTGLPFRVERTEDFFVSSVPGYSNCSLFDGVIKHEWNVGENFRATGTLKVTMTAKPISCSTEKHLDQTLKTTYQPRFSYPINQAKLQDDAAEFMELTQFQAVGLYRGYQALHKREQYLERLGEAKTVCFEEAFLLYALLSKHRFTNIVEIGTQYGKSTRKILDMCVELEIPASITCFDIVDQRKFIEPNECELRLQDLTGRFSSEVLDKMSPGLVFVDAHGFFLLTDIVQSLLSDRRGWVMAIHDCSKGLCNPEMSIGKEEEVTSSSGLWERYVLATAFGIEDPLDDRLERVATNTHQLRIFETPHGLAIIRPNRPNPLAKDIVVASTSSVTQSDSP